MNGVKAVSMASAALAGVAVLAAGPAVVASPDAGPAGTVAQKITAAPRLHRLAQMRAATARFHGIATAEAAGYVPFTDVNGISCIAQPGVGGMGVHYVNPKLIADPAINPRKPEALVYAPSPDGTLHLAALEYIVDEAAWNAEHRRAPRLFRHRSFDRTAAPNRFGLDAFYSQHVWVWKRNPAGLLEMWNPKVHCGPGA